MIPSEAPAAPLRDFILAALTPLLATGALGQARPDQARLAAEQAVDAYEAQGHEHLIDIGRMVGLSVAALDNLRLSMAQDVPLSMKLRLRGNANALSRTIQRNRDQWNTGQRAMGQPNLSQREAGQPGATTPDSRPFPASPSARPPVHFPAGAPTEAPPPLPADPEREAHILASLQEVRALLGQARSSPQVGKSSEAAAQRLRDLAWAGAMADIAAEYGAGLADLAPAQRRADLARIGALTRTAHTLTRGDVPLRSRLLGGTSLATTPIDPRNLLPSRSGSRSPHLS